MQVLYSIGIWAYSLALQVVALWNKKAKRMLQGRKESKKQWKQLDKNSYNILFHCASVGEFEQGLPLMQILTKEWPQANFITTFFSPSGYAYAKQKFPNETVLYLPLDSKKAMSDFVDALNPQLVIIIKYEFWFNLLGELKQRNIPTYLVSGIFRKNQLFFKRYGSFFRRKLEAFNHFFVQDNVSVKLLASIGFKNVSLSGDTRFDRVLENAKQSFDNQLIQQFVASEKIFVAGSVWQTDVESLNYIISKLPIDWKIIIVPHELHHFSMNWLNEPAFYYSNGIDLTKRVMLLDQMGLLSKLYRVATFAYIGGGFGKSIHNILEAAVYKIPVVFGPKWQKFNEAKQLIEMSCAFDVSEPNFNSKILPKLLQDEAFYSIISEKLDAFFSQNANVAEKIGVLIMKEQEVKMKTFFNN